MNKIIEYKNSANIYELLLEVQKELGNPEKNKENSFLKNKYAGHYSIMNMCKPVLHRHDLSVIQPLSNMDGVPSLKTILFHKSGESLVSELPLPALNYNAKNPIQEMGKAISYYRRYALMCLFNISTDADDDDGAGITPYTENPNTKEPKQNPAPKKKNPEKKQTVSEDQVAVLEILLSDNQPIKDHIMSVLSKSYKISKLSDLPVKKYDGLYSYASSLVQKEQQKVEEC